MRANSAKSPAVRFFTIHSFDDRPDIRAAAMTVLLDHLAAGPHPPADPRPTAARRNRPRPGAARKRPGHRKIVVEALTETVKVLTHSKIPMLVYR